MPTGALLVERPYSRTYAGSRSTAINLRAHLSSPRSARASLGQSTPTEGRTPETATVPDVQGDPPSGHELDVRAEPGRTLAAEAAALASDPAYVAEARELAVLVANLRPPS